MPQQIFPTDRPLFWISVALVAVGIALAALHPLFAVLAGLFCALVSLKLFDAISRLIFDKKFMPPSKAPGLPWPKWSDWVLFIPWTITFVVLLFFFGELGDCLAEKDIWKGWFNFCH